METLDIFETKFVFVIILIGNCIKIRIMVLNFFCPTMEMIKHNALLNEKRANKFQP